MHPQNKYERQEAGKRKSIKRAKGQVSNWPPKTRTEKLKQVEDLAKKLKDSTTLCNCCGNPRRKGWGEELTLQERRNLEADND